MIGNIRQAQILSQANNGYESSLKCLLPRRSQLALRHANATLLDAVGTPPGTVQDLLAHSSSEITRGVYLHSIPADARAAVEKVENLLNRPKLTQIPEGWEKGSSLIQ